MVQYAIVLWMGRCRYNGLVRCHYPSRMESRESRHGAHIESVWLLSHFFFFCPPSFPFSPFLFRMRERLIFPRKTNNNQNHVYVCGREKQIKRTRPHRMVSSRTRPPNSPNTLSNFRRSHVLGILQRITRRSRKTLGMGSKYGSYTSHAHLTNYDCGSCTPTNQTTILWWYSSTSSTGS